MANWLDDEALLAALTDGPSRPSGLAHLTGERGRGDEDRGHLAERSGSRENASAETTSQAVSGPPDSHALALERRRCVLWVVLEGVVGCHTRARRDPKERTAGAVFSLPPKEGRGRHCQRREPCTAALTLTATVTPGTCAREPDRRGTVWRGIGATLCFALFALKQKTENAAPLLSLTLSSSLSFPADEERLFHALGDGFTDLGGSCDGGGEGEEDDGIDDKQVRRRERMQLPAVPARARPHAHRPPPPHHPGWRLGGGTHLGVLKNRPRTLRGPRIPGLLHTRARLSLNPLSLTSSLLLFRSSSPPPLPPASPGAVSGGRRSAWATSKPCLGPR